jgi:hypothetical protein
MTNTPSAPDDKAHRGSSTAKTNTEQRYLYCLVDTSATSVTEVPAKGVDNVSVRLVSHREVGAVVQDREYPLETERLDQLKQWVMSHQRVVDKAGETFGTPLPVRFNTILEGGDGAVSDWLASRYSQIHDELATLAGTWEYRLHLLWNSTPFEETVTEDDDELQQLIERKEQAGSGTAFLLEKKYEKRLRSLIQERRDELRAKLWQIAESIAVEVAEQPATAAMEQQSPPESDERIGCLAVRVPADAESTLGQRLDEFVDETGAAVRFTGPWPPYTFVSDL